MAQPLYRSYVFKTKDPSVDELRTVIETHYGHRLTKKDLLQIEQDGGPKKATMANWFFGAVRRPQNATLEAAGRALGYRRTWTKMKDGK